MNLILKIFVTKGYSIKSEFPSPSPIQSLTQPVIVYSSRGILCTRKGMCLYLLLKTQMVAYDMCSFAPCFFCLIYLVYNL